MRYTSLIVVLVILSLNGKGEQIQDCCWDSATIDQENEMQFHDLIHRITVSLIFQFINFLSF